MVLPSILTILVGTYVGGVVASIHGTPVFWSEVVCRARIDQVALEHPDDPKGSSYIKKRVYDKLIVDYHKLLVRNQDPQDSKKELCDHVKRESMLVQEWLKRQQKVWGADSEKSFRNLLLQLEQTYEVSWRDSTVRTSGRKKNDG